MMDKRFMISMPAKLYTDLVEIAKRDYTSISAFIRRALMEKIEDEFTTEELALIKKGQETFRKSKGISWRKIKREHS